MEFHFGAIEINPTIENYPSTENVGPVEQSDLKVVTWQILVSGQQYASDPMVKRQPNI